jgi:pyruvate formate lyase activating enzyme
MNDNFMTTPRPTGRILHLQRLSTEDGPGLRTTVFFKGCPLRCAWCHNPESISTRVQTQWFAVRCLGCKTCVEACPDGCLALTDSGMQIDRERCQACGTCAQACPSGAMEAIGKTVSVDELLVELLKDRAYFEVPAFSGGEVPVHSGGEKSGGGVTLSGGEPAFQPEFAEALLQRLKEQGISTALDTCGLASRSTLERILPHTDLVLFDLKLIDDTQHRQWTGQSNKRILENLLYVREYMQHQARPTSLWVRTPLIPGATDSDENLLGIGRYLAARLDGAVSRWELCAFNNLCRDQYARLDLEWAFAATPLMTAAELSHCEQVARSAICRPQIVLATGATRI